MLNSLLRISAGKFTTLAFFAVASAAFSAPVAAQTNVAADKPQSKDSPGDAALVSKMMLIRSGYTRPGNPNDIIKDGKVLPVAGNDDYKGRYIGATVYFAVFEQTGLGGSGDVFATGHAGIDNLFKEGRSISGQYSPGFDASAKYLYVYQIVNDRGLDPKQQPAGASRRDLRTEDIVSSTIKLLVDPREITSWGHFTNTAFATSVTDRDFIGKAPSDDGKNERKLQVALSSHPAVLDLLPYPEYLAIAPALSLRNLKDNFGVGRSDLNLANSKAFRDLKGLKDTGANLVRWQDNMLASGKCGREPSFVQIDLAPPPAPGSPLAMLVGQADLPSADVQMVGKNMARSYLKVDWSGDQILKLGEHSVVFGFTSNLPPVDEVVRVISSANETGADKDDDADIEELVDGHGPGVGHGQLAAPGTVPTPFGAIHSGWSGAASWGGGPISGLSSSGGAFTVGTGFLSAGPRPPSTGGGAGAGSGGGSTQSLKKDQTVTEGSTSTSTTTTTCEGHDNVVPEPATLALATLGLPALFVVLRRRKSAAAESSQG